MLATYYSYNLTVLKMLATYYSYNLIVLKNVTYLLLV